MIVITTKSNNVYVFKTEEFSEEEIADNADRTKQFLNETEGFLKVSSYERTVILAIDTIESWEFLNE